jgi:hypothetical protein
MLYNIYLKISNFINSITLKISPSKVANDMDKHIIANKISTTNSNVISNVKEIINTEPTTNFFSLFDINNFIHSFPIKFSAMAQPEFFIPFCGAFVVGSGLHYYYRSYYFGPGMSPIMKESLELKKKLLQYMKEDPTFDDNLYLVKLFKIYKYMIKEHLKYGDIFYLSSAGLYMYIIPTCCFCLSMAYAIAYLVAESKVTN